MHVNSDLEMKDQAWIPVVQHFGSNKMDNPGEPKAIAMFYSNVTRTRQNLWPTNIKWRIWIKTDCFLYSIVILLKSKVIFINVYMNMKKIRKNMIIWIFSENYVYGQGSFKHALQMLMTCLPLNWCPDRGMERHTSARQWLDVPVIKTPCSQT